MVQKNGNKSQDRNMHGVTISVAMLFEAYIKRNLGAAFDAARQRVWWSCAGGSEW
jgi:hypothetical protein